MENSFSDLIKQFGVPKIIIPNQKTALYLGYPSEDNLFRKQSKYGESEFLAVKSRTETWVSNEDLLIKHLIKQNLEIIETVYFRKSDYGSGRYTTGDWKESKVTIATNTDVEPLVHRDFLKAVEERRVLYVGGWGSMGDGQVDFRLCRIDNPPRNSGYHFLFPPPCSLDEKMLFRMGDGYEWEEEFFNCYAHYFSRPFEP